MSLGGEEGQKVAPYQQSDTSSKMRKQSVDDDSLMQQPDDDILDDMPELDNFDAKRIRADSTQLAKLDIDGKVQQL